MHRKRRGISFIACSCIRFQYSSYFRKLVRYPVCKFNGFSLSVFLAHTFVFITQSQGCGVINEVHRVFHLELNGKVTALVIMNFQDSTAIIKMNLKNTGILLGQTPINLLEKGKAMPVLTENYQVTLPPRGFVMLGVQNDL